MALNPNWRSSRSIALVLARREDTVRGLAGPFRVTPGNPRGQKFKPRDAPYARGDKRGELGQSLRKRARTPTPPVGGILPNAEGRPPKRSAAAAMERTVLNRA